MACHHSRAITHTALDLTKQEVKVHITEAQPNNDKPHLYGLYLNEGRTEKIRVFPGPLQGTPDSNIKQLIQVQDVDLAKSGLCLKVMIWGMRHEESVHWSGAALPYEQQDPADKGTLDSLISWQVLKDAKTEPRSPLDVVSEGKITSSNTPDQITKFFQQGDNPGLLLTKSTARLQGKTDQGLMVILRVAAELKGVQVSDLINEVMWDAVKSGKLWDCQPDNGMP